MAIPKEIQVLFDWKVASIKDKIRDIDAKIAKNNAEIRRLVGMSDTDLMIEALEGRNEILNNEKKEREDELDRFKKGNNGLKYSLAKGNMTRARDSALNAAMALPATDPRRQIVFDAANALTDILKDAADALPDDF